MTIGLDYVDRCADCMPHGALVLDIGCGTGVPITRRLVERGFCVHGLDLSEEMLARAKRNVDRATFFHGDITTWDAPVCYDGVVAWDSIFHLTPSNHPIVLRRIVAMLKPNGTGLVTCGVQKGEVDSSMFGQAFYYSSPSIEGYVHRLEELGCRIRFREIDDSTGGGHAIVCFERMS
jgi:cyclopropane fatty-acyl-phospholipid synthase-like methyltransferase